MLCFSMMTCCCIAVDHNVQRMHYVQCTCCIASATCSSAAWGVESSGGGRGGPAARSHRKNALHLSRPGPALPPRRHTHYQVTGVWHLSCSLLPKLPQASLCSPRELDGGRAQESKVSARYVQVTASRPIRGQEILGGPMGLPGLPDVKPRGRRSSTGSPVVPQ